MKNIKMDTAQITCGLLKGPHRAKETWRWNEEVRAKEEKVWKLEERKIDRGMQGATKRVNQMQKGLSS